MVVRELDLAGAKAVTTFGCRDDANRTITLSQAGNTRFYRLTGAAVRIKGIGVANGKVTIRYE